MGQEVQQDLAISIKVMLAMLNILKNEWPEASLSDCLCPSLALHLEDLFKDIKYS
jgi:hypothetical protein